MASDVSLTTEVANKPLENARRNHPAVYLLVRLLIYAAVFALYYYFSFLEVYNTPKKGTDLQLHLGFAAQYFAGHFPDAYPGLYLMWFVVAHTLRLSLTQSAFLVDPLLAVAVAIIIRKVLEYAGFTPLEQIAYTIILLVVTPIYDPLFNQNLYLGQISANVYHNPTLLAVKPFAYLGLILYVKGLRSGASIKFFVWASAAILLSIVMKPNFVLAFIPALFIYLALNDLLTRKVHFARWWQAAVITALVVALLGVQFVVTYQQPSDPSHVVVAYLAVWSLYTHDPFFSILLSSAFPLSIVAFRWKQVIRNDYLTISWLSLAVGILEFAFLAETGKRFANANFGWGMQAMISFVFLFSIIEWVRWIHDTSNTRLRWGLYLAGLLLAAHFVSGAYYIYQIMTTHLFYIA